MSTYSRKFTTQAKPKHYIPLQFNEAFSAGSHRRVLVLLEKILNKRVRGKVRFDFDIPRGYVNNFNEHLRTYVGFLKNRHMIYLNFLLKESDYIHSFYLVNRKTFRATEAYTFDENTNIVTVVNTLVDFFNGTLDADVDDDSMEESVKMTEGVAEERQKIFQMWLLQSEDKNNHYNMIVKAKPKEMYKDFVLSMEKEFPETVKSKYFPDSNAFVKMVKNYAKSNGINNPNIKFRAVRKTPKPILHYVTLPEEQGVAEKVMGAEVGVMMSDWRAEFEKIEKKLNMILAISDAPYGMLIYGTGGTGKSFYANKVAKNMGNSAVIEKDIKNTADFRNKLFAYRDKELLIFDDADKVIQSKDMCTLLKTALDDTVGEMNNGVRYIALPPGTNLKAGDPGVTADGMSYEFKPDVVIITNSDKVADPALWTRLLKAPIYMSKQDIMDKIVENSKEICAKYGISKDQTMEVADYIVSLMENESLGIQDSQLSFRLFKSGVQFIKFDPTGWRGMLNTELLVGVKLAKDIQKRK